MWTMSSRESRDNGTSTVSSGGEAVQGPWSRRRNGKGGLSGDDLKGNGMGGMSRTGGRSGPSSV